MKDYINPRTLFALKVKQVHCPADHNSGIVLMLVSFFHSFAVVLSEKALNFYA